MHLGFNDILYFIIVHSRDMIIITASYKFNTYNMFFKALSLNIIMYIQPNVIFTMKEIKQI